MCATYGDRPADFGRMEELIPFFGRVQGFPLLAIPCECRAAFRQRCLGLWVVLQPSSKEVDLVLNPGGALYKTTASAIDLSRSPCSAKTGIRVISVTCLTDDNRRMSRTDAKRKIRSKSSMGSLSVSGGRFGVGTTLKSDVAGCKYDCRLGAACQEILSRVCMPHQLTFRPSTTC